MKPRICKLSNGMWECKADSADMQAFQASTLKDAFIGWNQCNMALEAFRRGNPLRIASGKATCATTSTMWN